MNVCAHYRSILIPNEPPPSPNGEETTELLYITPVMHEPAVFNPCKTGLRNGQTIYLSTIDPEQRRIHPSTVFTASRQLYFMCASLQIGVRRKHGLQHIWVVVQ